MWLLRTGAVRFRVEHGLFRTITAWVSTPPSSPPSIMSFTFTHFVFYWMSLFLRYTEFFLLTRDLSITAASHLSHLLCRRHYSAVYQLFGLVSGRVRQFECTGQPCVSPCMRTPLVRKYSMSSLSISFMHRVFLTLFPSSQYVFTVSALLVTHYHVPRFIPILKQL